MSGDKTFRTPEEIRAYFDQMRASTPRWKRAYYAVERAVKNWRRPFTYVYCFVQRGRRGFSYRDAWSFDTYMCRMIADGLEHLAAVSYGYPNEFESFEAWQAWLVDRAVALENWSVHFDLDYDAQARAYAKAVKAMHDVADKLGSLWD